MDRIWTDLIKHCADLSAEGSRIMGPRALASALKLAYDYDDRPDVEAVDVLILHKGDFSDLDVRFVQQVLRLLPVHFANEVFIVFARGEPEAPVEARHTGVVAEIEQWIKEGGYRDGVSEALIISDKPRMAATYVGQGRVLLQNAFGQLMLVAGEDTSIVPHLMRDGWFDLDLTRFLSRTLRAGQVFVDVGANFGTYSLLAAALVGPAGHVVSIEANRRIAGMLNENMVMNGFGARSTVIREAAAEAAGLKTMFQFAIRQGGSTMLPTVADLAKTSYDEQVVEEEVSCRSLDAILEAIDIEKVDFIKIDVEGFEASVLKGAFGCIRTLRPKLIVEWHPSFLPDGADRELHHILADKLGYSLRVIEPTGVTRCVNFDELSALPHADILAIPNADAIAPSTGRSATNASVFTGSS